MTSSNCFEARISPYLSLYRFRLTSKTAYYLHLDRITHPNFVSKLGCEYGRSGEAQTRGLRIPNAAHYQLRYTPIVIKLWSCKWSNLWSNTFLTAIFCFPNRPKSARLKGFLRFSLSCGAKTAYAPKRRGMQREAHRKAAGEPNCKIHGNGVFDAKGIFGETPVPGNRKAPPQGRL